MGLTKHFKETIKSRVENDPEFREALLGEAVSSFLSGDMETGKSILRDFINATIGFEELAREIDKPSKSLHRMLSPIGNPTTKTFFELLAILQTRDGIKLVVKPSALSSHATDHAPNL